MSDSARITSRKQAEIEKKLAPTVGRKNLALLLAEAEYAGDPTNNLTPDFASQYCKDTTNGALYWASTAASSGWKKLTP